jgi:Protein of unknown function (DUF3667)
MTIVCKNCATHFKGKFCPQCAQKASTGRLQVGNVLHEFWHNLTHTDHSVFSFIKGMIANPGIVIREFIEGKRKKYFNPYTFFILITGILIFITSRLFEYEDSLYKVRNEQGQFLSKHYNLIIICCLPVLAIFIKMTFRQYKEKYNYAEWITFFVFTFGMINFIQIFIQLLFFPLIKYHFEYAFVSKILGYGYLNYVLYRFIKPKNILHLIGFLFYGFMFYWMVEKVGSGIVLWLWGVPKEEIFKSLNL